MGNREECRSQGKRIKMAEPEELKGHWALKSEPERVSLKNHMPSDGCVKS